MTYSLHPSNEQKLYIIIVVFKTSVKQRMYIKLIFKNYIIVHSIWLAEPW